MLNSLLRSVKLQHMVALEMLKEPEETLCKLTPDLMTLP